MRWKSGGFTAATILAATASAAKMFDLSLVLDPRKDRAQESGFDKLMREMFEVKENPWYTPWQDGSDQKQSEQRQQEHRKRGPEPIKKSDINDAFLQNFMEYHDLDSESYRDSVDTAEVFKPKIHQATIPSQSVHQDPPLRVSALRQYLNRR